MKSHIYLLAALVFLLAGSQPLQAQGPRESLPISIGYWGEMAIHPGIRLGAQFSLQKWEKERDGKDWRRTRDFYVHPQIGTYSWSQNHTNFYLGADVGLKTQKSNKGFFSAYSIGLGYFGRSQIEAITFSLADGSILAKDRDWRSFFLPSLNYTLGSRLSEQLDWYVKGSYGLRLNPNFETSAMVLLELGLLLHL